MTEDFAESVIENTVVGIIVIDMVSIVVIDTHGYQHARRQRWHSCVHRLPCWQRQSQRRDIEPRDSKRRCDTMLDCARQVVTTARRWRGRSRVNRTGNGACGLARNQRRIAIPPVCTCTKAIDYVAADRTTGSRRACRRVSLLTRMRDVNSAADETISR